MPDRPGSTAPAATATAGPAAPDPAFPAILRGGRRALFARLLANGALQAGLTLLLAFLVRATESAGLSLALGGIAALGAALLLLRMAELADAERLGLDYVAELRLKLYDGIAGGRRMSHGVAMTRMMNDLSALRHWAGLGFARSFTAALALGGCLAAAASFSAGHLVAIAIPAALVGLAALAAALPLTARIGEVRRARGRLASIVGEALLAAGILSDLGAAEAMRRRIRRTAEAMNERLIERIRVAAWLRALPDAMVPGAVIAALALDLPLGAGSVGLVLLAGLATGPVRQLLRALEHRAAFRVARERLAPALGERRRAGGRPPRRVRIAGSTPVLDRSLRRNIDLARRHRGEEAALEAIARECGLLDTARTPDGLATRLDPEDPALDEGWRARLALARAIAAGAPAIRIEAPALLAEAGTDALALRLARLHGVEITVSRGNKRADAA